MSRDTKKIPTSAPNRENCVNITSSMSACWHVQVEIYIQKYYMFLLQQKFKPPLQAPLYFLRRTKTSITETWWIKPNSSINNTDNDITLNNEISINGFSETYEVEISLCEVGGFNGRHSLHACISSLNDTTTLWDIKETNLFQNYKRMFQYTLASFSSSLSVNWTANALKIPLQEEILDIHVNLQYQPPY